MSIYVRVIVGVHKLRHVTQLVEYFADTEKVRGPNPRMSTNFGPITPIGRVPDLHSGRCEFESHWVHEGNIVQLVKNACLTSKKSGVRISLFPQCSSIPNGRGNCFKNNSVKVRILGRAQMDTW